MSRPAVVRPGDWGCYIGDSHFVHVMPEDDLREHDISESCWCAPRPDVEEEFVMVHNSMDRREEYEQGRKLS